MLATARPSRIIDEYGEELGGVLCVCGLPARRRGGHSEVFDWRAVSVSVLHVDRLQLLQWTLHHHQVRPKRATTIIAGDAACCSICRI